MEKAGAVMFEILRKWVGRMLSKSDIYSIYGVRSAMSNEMCAAINGWVKMYSGCGSHIDKRKGIHSLRMEQAVVREFANTALGEMTLKVSEEKLDGLMTKALKDLPRNFQRGLASGAMIIKPLGADKVQYVSQEQFIPIEYDVNGRLLKVIFPEIKRVGENEWRIRLEYHSLDYKKGLTITNRAFCSYDGVTLGREIPLSAVDEWALLPPMSSYPLMLRPAFGYYVNPIDNTVDGSLAGVSIFESAREVIKKADIQFGRLDWEFESGERAVDVDEAVLKTAADPFTGFKRTVMPGLRERLFRGMNISGGANGDFYHEFSPQLRQADFIAGLEEYKREIEFAAGLSYGDISDPQIVDKTATEIKSSKQRKYNTVTAIQQSLRTCFEDLCYAIAFYARLTQSGYELTVNFEDSILADDETKRASDRQDVGMGVMPLWEYRMKWYGEDEATARKMTAESTAEVIG